ncbi:hypothetical protein MASR2M47_41010 [Draconibacterium sp.]|jgi:hypothetical protein
MKKISAALLILVFLCCHSITNAKEIAPANSGNDEFNGFYLGGTISTNGWGGEIKYIFNNKFTVRSGFESLKYSYDYNFDQNEIEYDAIVHYKTGGISLLGNFNFTRNFYLSAGVLFNSFNPKITGDAASGLEYGDIIIPPSMVGDFEFTIEPQLQVSPYGSVGFRSFFGKNKRVVLNTELGMYYMGPPKINISASGLLAPTADPAHGQKEILENQIEQYKFYPVLKLILAVKLF